jgi:uncharacterized protein (TIGR00725 family)
MTARMTERRTSSRTRTRTARSARAAERPIRIAVCGAGNGDAPLLRLAEQVGEEIARAGAALVCGGLGGVMEAAARGAQVHGGTTIGVLPGDDASAANPWISFPLPTGMGEARNALVVRFVDAVIAVGGEWGTLSEIALARKMGVPVVLLEPTLADGLELETADSAEDAVRRALRHARRRRTP